MNKPDILISSCSLGYALPDLDVTASDCGSLTFDKEQETIFRLDMGAKDEYNVQYINVQGSPINITAEKAGYICEVEGNLLHDITWNYF